MTAQQFAAAVGGALLLAAAPALAGPALPDPPFVDGGFVPDGSAVLRAEQGTATALSNLIKRIAKCVEKAVSADFKGDPDVASDQTACRSRALELYERALGRLSLPACFTLAVGQGLATSAIAHIDGVASDVFCDGPPSPSSGVNTPTSRTALKGEVGIWRAFSKALPQARKCSDRTVKDIFKGDDNALAKHTRCLQKAQLAYEATAGRLVGQGAVPACNPGQDVASLGLNSIYIQARTTTGESYCDQ